MSDLMTPIEADPCPNQRQTSNPAEYRVTRARLVRTHQQQNVGAEMAERRVAWEDAQVH
jgi:hypothetical protein